MLGRTSPLGLYQAIKDWSLNTRNKVEGLKQKVGINWEFQMQ